MTSRGLIGAVVAALAVPVTVRVATANGTAKVGQDYLKASRTLTFAPGTTTLGFAVTVKGDRAREGTETFKVLLSKVTNAAAGKAGIGTIKSDDR